MNRDLVKRLEQMAKRKEKDIGQRYGRLLNDINSELALSYRKYEKEGILTLEEMVKHDRLEKLMREVDGSISKADQAIKRDIDRHLKRQYKESYYQMAWLLETSTKAKLAYTPIKAYVLAEAVNIQFTGLTLNERLSKRRKELQYDMREKITRGLSEGKHYRTIAEDVSTVLEGDMAKANRIVRTESRRARETGISNSVKHAESKGIRMSKTWRNLNDERSRDTHLALDGTKIETNEMFDVNGYEADHPLDTSLPASEVVNCRCFLAYEVEAVEKPEDETLADLTYQEWQKERLSA